MDINIVSGNSSENINKFVFDLLKKRDKSTNHIIIAPDRCLFNLEERLFDELGEQCFFDISVMSLTRLAKSINKDHKDKLVLTKQSGIAIVRKLLIANANSLKIFNKSTNYLSLAESIYETICLFKSCNISHEQVFVDDSSDYSNLKNCDIKLIYQLYEQFIESRFTDNFNELKLFASLIDNKTFANTTFYFLEFDDFTRLIYDIIVKMSRFSSGIYIGCTFSKDNNSNIYLNKVYYDLIDIFKQSGLTFSTHIAPALTSSLHHFLSCNLLAYNPKKCEKTDKISISAFDSIQDEVKFVLSDIYSRAITQKIDYSHFVIAVPSIGEYKKLLITELKNYNIPYYFDESERLGTQTISRLIFDILGLVDYNFNMTDFANVLFSPLLNFDFSQARALKNSLNIIDAKGAMCLNHTIDDKDISEFQQLICQLHKQISTPTFETLMQVADKIFEYILVRAEAFFATLSQLETRTNNQVINKIKNINSEILRVFGNDQTNFCHFVEIYKSYFESTNISLPPITSNTLFVAEVGTSYLSRVSHLYVLGNNEGKLPSYSKDQGILTDSEIAKLPNAKLINPTIKQINIRKNFKVFELMLKFCERLHLSFCLSNNEGKLYPNNTVNSFVQMTGLSPINRSTSLDMLSNSYYTIDSNNFIFNNLTPNIAVSNTLHSTQNWEIYKDNKNFRTILSTLAQSIDSEKLNKIVDNYSYNSNKDAIVSDSYLSDSTTSVSQIECYYMCPYMHFARYGLRLREEADNQLQSNDIGNLFHEILKNLIPYAMENIDNLNLIENRALALFAQIISSQKYAQIAQNTKNIHIIKSLKKELLRICKAVVYQLSNSKYRPKYFEYKFGNSELVIDGVKIKGSIDRIDMYGDDCIVIDYKTGDSAFSNYNDVYSGKKLQLLVYAKAFKKTGKRVKGAFYLPITNKFSTGEIEELYRLKGVMERDESNIVALDQNLINSGSKSKIVNLSRTTKGKIFENNYYKYLCLEREDFEFLVNFALSKMGKAIDNIRAGQMSPKPIKEPLVCDYCKFTALCGYIDDGVVDKTQIQSISDLRAIGEDYGEI